MEALHLTAIGCKDAFASIRFSNIMLSLVLFVVFLKNRSLYRIKKIKPQRYVYGVYLVHTLILLEASPIVLQLVKTQTILYNIPAMVLIQCVFFAIVLLISYQLSMGIKNSRLRFLTGG